MNDSEVSAPSLGRPELDITKLQPLLIDAAISADRDVDRFDARDRTLNARRLRALATALPVLLEASRERDALRKYLDALNGTITAYYDEVKHLASQLTEARSRVVALEAELKDYKLLKQAVNESTNECLPGCSSYGHEGDCPSCDASRWLTDQQKEIVRLRSDWERAVTRAYQTGWLDGAEAGPFSDQEGYERRRAIAEGKANYYAKSVTPLEKP